MKHAARLASVLLLTVAGGCGLMQRTAVSTMIPIMDNALVAAYENGDVELVEHGLPAGIIMVDGLIETSPKDRRLLILGSQLYFSYGIGFVEEWNPARASGLYETAMKYGFQAFPDLSPEHASGPGGLADFEATLWKYKKKDVPGLLWLAGSWMSWIKLNLSQPSALAQLPRAELLAERIIELDGSYLYGMPHLLLGTALALRPQPMGGDPERALDVFEAGFAESERRFLMMHFFFAKYYCRQVFDEELFDRTIDELLRADPAALPDAVLLNRVAQAMGRRLADNKDDLF